MKKNLILSLTMFLILTVLYYNTWAEEKTPSKSQAEPSIPNVCVECHTDDTGISLRPKEELIDEEIEGIADLHKTFRHSSTFVERHKTYASQNDRLCLACHKTSFCTDCHAYKDELKPSLKYSDSPERWMPHRGDYIFQHRIDGKVDPAPCFRCHGRQNNKGCKVCHK